MIYEITDSASQTALMVIAAPDIDAILGSIDAAPDVGGVFAESVKLGIGRSAGPGGQDMEMRPISSSFHAAE